MQQCDCGKTGLCGHKGPEWACVFTACEDVQWCELSVHSTSTPPPDPSPRWLPWYTEGSFGAHVAHLSWSTCLDVTSPFQPGHCLDADLRVFVAPPPPQLQRHVEKPWRPAASQVEAPLSGFEMKR